MKKLSIATFLLLFTCIFSTTAFASQPSNNVMINSTTPTFEYNYDSDILTITVIEESEPYVMERNSGFVYKDATHSKYFYIISTGERVANYSLTANFRYDSTDEIAECRSTSITRESIKDGWSITGSSTTESSSDALAYGLGRYELKKDGEINNSDTIKIYCDHNGNITKS